MKKLASMVGERWRLIFLYPSLLFLGLALVWPAIAQTFPPAKTQPEAPIQPADEDPFGRSTPYGTVMGFVRAAAHKDYTRAVQYLDTRERGTAAEELAQQLKSVLDRGLTADLDNLSKKAEGDLQDGLRMTRDRVGTININSGELEILLDRIDRRGQSPIWLFSSETLALIPAAVEEISSFSIEKYIPSILVEIKIFSWPIFRWIVPILLLIIIWSLSSLVSRAAVPLLRPLLRRLTGEEDDRVVVSIRAPIRLIVISVAIRWLSTISVSLLVRQFWARVASVVAVIALAWLVIQFSDIVSELGIRRLRSRQMAGKIAVWALIRRLFKALVAIVAALWLLHGAGVDLTAILTGLGVGGIAVALAAQKTLENLFGGMMIISDEPMRVGDFCRIADQMGTIEDIGLRSTRVRTLSRTVIAIPNGQLAVMNVENFSVRDKIWFHHLIGLRCETSADQLRYVLAEIRTMLYSHPKVESDSARIRFVGFGSSSLDLEIFAYVKANEMTEFLGIQEDLLLRIMDIIAKGGTSIAFPSQTTYLAKDTPLNSQKTEEAVTQVRQWRERGELPFPDIPTDQVGRLQGKIEYPPPESSLRSGNGGPAIHGR